MKQVKTFCDRCGKEAKVYDIPVLHGYRAPDLCRVCEVELHKAISGWWPEFGKQHLFRTIHDGMQKQAEATKQEALWDAMR
jgi:hypothetical protein